MVYITGDIHGQTDRIIWDAKRFGMTENDLIILLGDVGANYYLNKRDKRTKEALSSIKPTILCIHGNHEARPAGIEGYARKLWNGGMVYFQHEYPNLLFAQDGEIFDLIGLKCIALGGAYSVDKFYRMQQGYAWFPDEQPTEETKAYAEGQLRREDYKVDIILSHTCPFKYEPIEMFIPGLDQSKVDDSTEKWLDKIEEMVDYKAWYCGHWHTNKRIDKIHFLFDGWEILEDLK